MLAVGLFAQPALAQAPIQPFPPLTEDRVVQPQEIATNIALNHGINVGHFLKVIECESNWNTKAVGDGGTSFGLAQLHFPVSDWHISIEQAEDPITALEIMAEAWDRGEQGRWTCWRLLYGKLTVAKGGQ